MNWEEESYSRRDAEGNLISLEEYESQQEAKLTGFNRFMSKGDLKLYAICGVGFMLDAYDLFIINLVNPIWTYEYFGGLSKPQPKSITYPVLLKGAVNAGANIGNVIGQILFGFMGDTFGRKFVYGKELIIAIVGIVLTISLPNYLEPTRNKFWYLFGFRVLMGIGIGGDYPMSAAIVAERSSLKNRGRMLALIFSNQGWGTLLASIMTLIFLGCFSSALQRGEFGQLDAIWRLQIGVAIVPCLITLYFRLTMPESRKFQQSTELTAASLAASSSTTVNSVQKEKNAAVADIASYLEPSPDGAGRKRSIVEAYAAPPAQGHQDYRTFIIYFSEWRHAKTLIGTALSWFLVDIAFYGTNLNQSVLLTSIGFSKGSTEYHTLVINACGNLIIAIAGYVPGYFITVALIDVLGRKWIQIQGFLVTALMFGILAGDYGTYNSTTKVYVGGLGTGGKFACFVIAQLFFNFGPNATTFIVPGEIFPSRVRGLAHGFSAAVGKLGAILAGVLFNYLSQETILGIANVLWIFFACGLLGAIVTFFFVPESRGVDADAIDFAECEEALRQKHGGVIQSEAQ